jgi:hypothetical protein
MHAATATAEVAAAHMWNSAAAADMRRSTSASMTSTAATSSRC